MRLSRRLVGGGRKALSLHPPFWANEQAAFQLGRSMRSNREWVEHNFDEYVRNYYKDNGIVFACILARMWVFSEALFRWQKLVDGRPGDLFYTDELKILDYPEGEDLSTTTGDMLVRIEQDGSLAGNSYHTFSDATGKFGKATDPATRRIVRLRPDQTEIIIHSPSGNPWGLDARRAGYLFRPAYAAEPIILTADEVAHFAPIPDPAARFRGMSWVTPIIRETLADREAMEHKKMFFRNGATLGHIIRMAETVGRDDFLFFVEKFNEQHQGFENAYNTLFIGGGADVTALGTDFRQLEFAKTQGQGETRIAAAAGVPPIIVGLSEGLQAATYSNYSQARRRFADGGLSPLWRMAAGSLSTLIDKPSEPCRLWYDKRDIPFLREDVKDQAAIDLTRAQAVRHLVEAGFEDEAAVETVDSGDFKRLIGRHTGMLSVQLFEPGAEPPGKRTGENEDPRQPRAEEDDDGEDEDD